jgi:hypothetical protein
MTIHSLKCWIKFILISPKLKFRHEIIKFCLFVFFFFFWVSLGCIVSALLSFFSFVFFLGGGEGVSVQSFAIASFKQELYLFKLVHSKCMNLFIYQMFWNFCNLFFTNIFFKSNDAFSLFFNMCLDSWKDMRYMHRSMTRYVMFLVLW